MSQESCGMGIAYDEYKMAIFISDIRGINNLDFDMEHIFGALDICEIEFAEQ